MAGVEDGGGGQGGRKNSRIVALAAMALGASASVLLTLYAGRHNASLLLAGLFIAWVGSPFAFLYIAERSVRRWSANARVALSITAVTMSVASTGIYAFIALGPPRPRGAFVFVVVPPVSWMVVSAVFVGALIFSRSRPDTD